LHTIILDFKAKSCKDGITTNVPPCTTTLGFALIIIISHFIRKQLEHEKKNAKKLGTTKIKANSPRGRARARASAHHNRGKNGRART
jgi:hypothetical protein